VHGEHLIVAERAGFADAVLAALSDPASGARLAANARVLVRESYDWSTVGEAACDAVARLC
jgi:glycosyltransferase involved in cell wall biosynthesis